MVFERSSHDTGWSAVRCRRSPWQSSAAGDVGLQTDDVAGAELNTGDGAC